MRGRSGRVDKATQRVAHGVAGSILYGGFSRLVERNRHPSLRNMVEETSDKKLDLKKMLSTWLSELELQSPYSLPPDK